MAGKKKPAKKKTTKKAVTKKVAKPTPVAVTKVKCPDCNAEYEAGVPHNMFCPAKTCRECQSTFGYVLPVYDSRPEAQDEEGNPERLCDDCIMEREERGEEDFS